MPPQDNNQSDDSSYLLPPKEKGQIEPTRNQEQSDADLAADLIRKKLEHLYQKEPAARDELAVADLSSRHSRHQQFIHELSNSGKSLAEIQTAWHEYYAGLSDLDKHKVWQEFYQAHQQNRTAQSAHSSQPHTLASHHVAPHNQDSRSPGDIKSQILAHSQRKPRRASHGRSLLFGLGVSSLVVLVLLFGFFNERFIAPFITPSRNVSATPIIVDPNSIDASGEPRIIIPKINVEVPVVYDQPSVEESAIQNSLERGVVHYAISSLPGEQGNTVIVGHSSNNILNKGKYKFAFVMLSKLENGDTFMLIKDGKRYVYKVYEKRIVKPTDVSVLATSTKPVVTLITCDPPGTSTNRLIVVGEQITPDPAANVASSAKDSSDKPEVVPGNAPSLWQRIKRWFTG
jgi:sortase A